LQIVATPRFSLRSILVVVTSACVVLGGFAYLRQPSAEELAKIKEERARLIKLEQGQQRLFRYLDSVFAVTPGFTSSDVKRMDHGETTKDWREPRGCLLYGSETRTMVGPDGQQVKVGVMQFTVSGPVLARNQKFHTPISPVHEPYLALSEIWNGKEFTRAIADEALQIDVGSQTIPVGYAKWRDSDGSYINVYSAWLADGVWIDPFDRVGDTRVRIPRVSARSLQNGVEILRVTLGVTTNSRDEEVPRELIQDIVKMVVKKLPQPGP
jgi:hypothetical protein